MKVFILSGGFHIMEVSMIGVAILWSCPYYGGFHIMEVSMMGLAILWRCPYYEGVHIMEVSILWRYP